MNNISFFEGWYAAYRGDYDTRDFIHMVMSLAILPPEVIGQTFAWLKTIASSAAALRLLEYYEKNWIKKWTVNAFSVFRRKIRTNNDLEGKHVIEQNNVSIIIERPSS